MSATVQRDIKIWLASWIASSGRLISIVEDGGLQQVLLRAVKNSDYKLSCRRTIDKLFNEMYDGKRASVKEAVKNSKAITLTSDFFGDISRE